MLHLLPTEVRDLIYYYLDQQDLLNVLCVCKSFSEAVIPALWSTVWVDCLQISGFRDATTITQKALADCRLNLPVDFVHEKKRRYMFIGRNRLRDFCYGLQRGHYTFALSCVKTLNVSLEYTLQPCHVMGTLEECDELGLVHWLIEEIPRYFTGLTQLEILTESVTEETGPAVSKLDFDNVPTNMFLTIEHSHLSRLGKVNFSNIKVLRLEITFQERLSYDLAKHFKSKLPDTVERFDLVNYAESSILASGFVKFVQDCKRLKSLTMFTPVLADEEDSRSIATLPRLELLHLGLSNASILKYINAPNLERMSLESFSYVDPNGEAFLTLLQSFQHFPHLGQLHLENVSLPCIARIMCFSKESVRSLAVHGSMMEVTDSYAQDLAKLANHCGRLRSLLLDIHHTASESSKDLLSKFINATDNEADDPDNENGNHDENRRSWLRQFYVGEPEALYQEYAQECTKGQVELEDEYGFIRLEPKIGRYMYKIDVDSI